MTTRTILAAAAAITMAWGLPARAQQQAPAVKRTVLQKHALRAPGQDGVMALVELPPGAREGRHTHAAEAFVYVLEGTIRFDVEGRPTATLKAGDSTFVEAGKIHEGINDGATPARALAVFVADQGKPLTTQAK